MTREEAIAVLQEEIDGNLELSLREWQERDEQKLFPAIRMAIEALQFAKHFDLLKEYQSLQEVVRCKDCRHLDVWNLKNIYAVCSKHGITFEPFEDDTRTHFCSWGERKGGDSE